jgi:flagellar FliL protein
MILIAVIALVALGVLGGGGFFAYKAMSRKSAPPPLPAEGDGKDAAAGGKAQDDDEEEEASEEGGGHEGAAAGPAVMVINRQSVNLEGPRKNAFLKCDVHVIFRNQELGKLATSDKPTADNSTIRALVLEALSGKTVEAAMDVETRERRQEVIDDFLIPTAGWHGHHHQCLAAFAREQAAHFPVRLIVVVNSFADGQCSLLAANGYILLTNHLYLCIFICIAGSLS